MTTEKRDTMLMLRVTGKEREKLREIADAAGASMSEIVRRLIRAAWDATNGGDDDGDK